MNTVKIFYIITIIFLIGCTSFIQVEAPKDQLLTSNVFTSDETAIAALTGIYIQMAENTVNYNIPMACGYASDELTCYSTFAPLVDLYLNSPRPADAFTNTFWNNGFFYIYQSNSVIEGCKNSTALNPDVQRQLISEAHFIRAFWLYYLVNFYGNIPLVLTSDYKANANIKQASVSEVYSQILNDLDFAATNLNEFYLNGSSRMTTTERLRPNQSAAKAFLARVHLSLENWNLAEQFATAIITKTTMYDTVAIQQVFLKDNKEAIWQLAEPTPRLLDISTKEAEGFVLFARPAAGNIKNSTASSFLLDAFEHGDSRLSNWIGSYSSEGETFLYPNKYKIARTSSLITEQSTVLRLAEQYLIRAEARFHLGNLEGAKQDINIVRERANLPPIMTVGDTELLSIIMKERQCELFSEWGHRWIDLKRTGYADQIMPIVLQSKQGGTWLKNMELWPIPQVDVDRNTSLIQNAGYN